MKVGKEQKEIIDTDKKKDIQKNDAEEKNWFTNACVVQWLGYDFITMPGEISLINRTQSTVRLWLINMTHNRKKYGAANFSPRNLQFSRVQAILHNQKKSFRIVGRNQKNGLEWKTPPTRSAFFEFYQKFLSFYLSKWTQKHGLKLTEEAIKREKKGWGWWRRTPGRAWTCPPETRWLKPWGRASTSDGGVGGLDHSLRGPYTNKKW